MNYLLGVLCVLWLYFSIGRTLLVLRERGRVLQRVHELATEDIKAHRAWEWRYEAYESISFWRMVFSLRPVDEFYDEWGSPEP